MVSIVWTFRLLNAIDILHISTPRRKLKSFQISEIYWGTEPFTKVECQIVSDKMGFGWRLFPTGTLVGVSDQFDAELFLAV